MKRFIKDAVFDMICDLAGVDESIVLLTADADAFGLRRFKQEFPNRFFNVGVAEQAMVSVAAGMALGGAKVFIYAIAPFVTFRCLEQIKENICMMGLPVFIIGLGNGVAFGFDGPSHQTLFDIGIMTNLPNIAVYNPSDYISGRFVIREAARVGKPAYIRVDKDCFEDLFDEESILDKGFRYIKKGSLEHAVIVSTGICSHYALNAGTELSVIDLYCLNTFDEKSLADELRKYEKLIVYEEQWSRAGIASIISNLIVENEISIHVKKIGIKEKDCIAHIFGSRQWLHNQYGIAPKCLEDFV